MNKQMTNNKPGRLALLHWGLTVALSICCTAYSNAQNIDATTPWVWKNGDTTVNKNGRYGTQGVASATNKPGARRQCASWTDNSNNFWLFGGYGLGGGTNATQGQLNDLWKYNPSAGQWTWVSGDTVINALAVAGTQGVPAAGNKPRSRYLPYYWKDNNNNLWIFGGSPDANDYTYLNDLWKFNTTTNEWTWVSGSPTTVGNIGVYGTLGVPAATNKPGSRMGGASWVDTSGNLWLYSGSGRASTADDISGLTDLWKYSIASGEWTWVSGDNTSSPNANFGTQNVAAATNKPGGRIWPVCWKDNNGNFWMMGGLGYVATGGQGMLNDVWKYDLALNQWTWMQGNSTANNQGLYISQGTASADRRPRSRMASTSWTDLSGNLWLFGGITIMWSTLTLNDIWKLDIATNQWTWVKGDSIENKLSVYNTMNVPDQSNEIGSRGVEISWREKNNNNVWVFGGHVMSQGNFAVRNDLWKIEACMPVGATQPINGEDTICANVAATYSIASVPGAFSYQWQLPSGWTGTSTTQTISVVNNGSGGTVSVKVLGTCGDTSLTQSLNVVIDAVTPTIIQTTPGGVLTLTVNNTYSSYQWLLNGVDIAGATSSTYAPVQNGIYSVKVTNDRGCTATSATHNVTGITAINEYAALAAKIKFYPNPAEDRIYIQSPVNTRASIMSIDGRVLLSKDIGIGIRPIDVHELSTGIYLLELKTIDGARIDVRKFVKK